VLFASYAGAFARRYPWIRHFTPVNEIFVCASFSALRGWWNECETSEASFVRAMRNLCMAHELAVEAILVERPDAIIVQGESIEHFHAAGREANTEADRWNGFKFLSVDLTTGHELAPGMARLLNEHGVTSNDLSFFRERRAVGQRWLGVDYYPSCEHRIASTGRATICRSPMGFAKLAGSYYRRYGLPIFYCETNRVSHLAVDWLDEQWGELMSLRDSGVPVTGFTWYSLTDQIDWQHALREERNELYSVGLYDLQRRIRPVGRRYRELVQEWRGRLHGTRFDRALPRSLPA
jgi:beta-glucosidase